MIRLDLHLRNLSRCFMASVCGRGGWGGRGGRSDGCGTQGRGRSSGRSSLICQLCHKSGHTSFNCWHRFDQNFQPSPPPPPPYAHFTASYPPPMASHPSPYPSTFIPAPFRIPSPASSSFSHSTSVATLESINDAAWYPDLGASSHVTPEYNNLMHASPYHGVD